MLLVESNCESSPIRRSNKHVFSRPLFWIRLGLLVLLVISFGPSLLEHMRYAADFGHYNDDVLQQIWPFLKYRDPALFRNDYFAQYYLDCMPPGYKALYISGSMVMDPRTLSKILPYPFFLLFILTMGRIGRRLAGELGMWLVVFLILGNDLFLARMTGGLPRMFAFPLLALMLLALLESRPRFLAGLTVIASLFYPVAAVIGGVMLAAWLLVLDKKGRGLDERWSWSRRLTWIILTAGLCFVCLSPTMYTSSQYGEKISTSSIADFPELKAGSRYERIDSYPFPKLANLIFQFVRIQPRSGGTPWPGVDQWENDINVIPQWSVSQVVKVFFLIGGLACCLLTMYRIPIRQRLLLFMFTSLILYEIAVWIYPTLYMPSRYAVYMLPIMVVLLISIGLMDLQRLVSMCLRSPKIAWGMIVILCIGCVMLTTRRGYAHAGYYKKYVYSQPIVSVLSDLPADALIAGWFYRPISDVPYLCERSVFISGELLQFFHKNYGLEVRARALALIDAYYAHKLSDITILRDKIGVTHLLLERKHIYKNRAKYFEPYDHYISQRVKGSKMRSLLKNELRDAVVYEDQQYILLDLNRLP